MTEWQVKRLEDLCSRITVGHVGSMTSRYVDAGIPFLRSLNIKRGYIDFSATKFIDQGFHEQLSKSQLRPGDLTIVRTGEPGTTAVVPHDVGPLNCSDIVIATPFPDVDARFLCYAINETAQSFVRAHTVGAVQQHFNVKSAKMLTLNVPPLTEQRAIANVLGALDDKIAVNDRIAATADELVLAIAASERWEARIPLSEICTLRKDQISPAEIADLQVDHYSLPAFDSRKRPERTSPRTIRSGKFLVTTPAVLFSKLNPEIPRVWNVKPEDGVPALASTEFLVLIPHSNVSTHELWAVTAQRDFREGLAARVTGTSKSHQRVRPAEVLSTYVVDPRRFGPVQQQVISVARSALAAREESVTLGALRDTLLPHLMSGGLRVKDAEKLIEDHA